MGSVLYGKRERYLDNEIKIEQTDKRQDDDDDGSSEMKT
jgi:hypothetical protein